MRTISTAAAWRIHCELKAEAARLAATRETKWREANAAAAGFLVQVCGLGGPHARQAGRRRRPVCPDTAAASANTFSLTVVSCRAHAAHVPLDVKCGDASVVRARTRMFV